MTQQYTTDDLSLAAALTAFGARVTRVTYHEAKRRSDISLDLSPLNPQSMRDMLLSLAERLGELPTGTTSEQLELALDGSVVLLALSRYVDLKRKVVSRKQHV